MTDRQIPFKGPMVRALLEGRKTMTRRLTTSPLAKSVPGDRLWVRESVRLVGGGSRRVGYRADGRCGSWMQDQHGPVFVPHGWLLNAPGRNGALGDTCRESGYGLRWRASIHMPRWASRLTLVITGTKIERLQEISEEDAKAEGAPQLFVDEDGKFYQSEFASHRTGFAGLWDHINGAGAWEANPEVVAISFRVVEANIDRVT